MPKLGEFSKNVKTVKVVQAEARQSGQRAKRRSPGEAPSGYDQDIWTLAVKFQTYARLDGIELAANLPAIHEGIESLVTRYDMRPQKFTQEVHGCDRRRLSPDLAARCWYHWPPDRPRDQVSGPITWVQKVEVIMAEFWSRIQNEYAVDQFRQSFAEYGDEALRHWRSLRIIKAIDAQPKTDPPVRRRRQPGDIMTAGSKEG